MRGTGNMPKNGRMDKSQFLMVMLVLLLTLVNRGHSGSAQIAEAFLGFGGFAALFGGVKSSINRT